MTNDRFDSTDAFSTCVLESCRPGIKDALLATVRLIRGGQPTIAVVLAPRYGKSHFIRQLSIELIERDIAGACLVLAPWQFLRDQLNADDKIEDMIKHHSINHAVIRPRPIVPDILSGKTDPEFYNAKPRRHWWSLTIAQAYMPETKAVLGQLAAQFKNEKKPLIVFIDESHLTSTENNGWGKFAAELKAAGAILILLTGTPERADNVAPFGFRTEEVSRTEFDFTKLTRINDEQTKIEYFEAEKVRYKLIPDVPMVGLQQAWKEKAITKLQHRFFAFKTNGELVNEVSKNQARRSLGVALRNSETIRLAVREMLDELRLRRQTDGSHGASAPATSAIVFVGNDHIDDEEKNDWHAREAQRAIEKEWSYFLPSTAKVKIITRHTEGNDSEKAAKTIKAFVNGQDDIVIVKQMGGVGLDSPRLKVGLDLSTIRTKSNTTQRWLRLATLWEDVTHGTMILPNDPITMQTWKEIVEEQGGQYAIENAAMIDTKIVDATDEPPDPKPFISDPQRGGSIDQSLRLVAASLDQKLDAILVKSPIFAIRFTRRELADEYEKGTFQDVESKNLHIENESIPIFDATKEVKTKQDQITQYCKDLASRTASYTTGDDPEEDELWVNQFRRWMSEAKTRANIRGKLAACRDIDKLVTAEGWLESQLGRRP